jgi:4-amino-4-deoxy-L-arabinose transferase-like glycosyltransferase
MQPGAQRRVSNTTLLLTGIFLLGLVLRLGWIDAHGLWNDEIISIATARNGLPYIFANRFGWLGNQTTWYYVLLWLVSQPFDPAVSPALVRLPSALAGAFLPLVVYGLGRELFSRTAGLVAALMAALSPVMLDYSHDVRPYSMLAFLTAISLYCLLMAERTGKAGWWAGFVAATVANLLNAYVALTLAIPPLALYLIWALWRAWADRRQEGRARRLVALLISVGVIALVGVAMLLEVMQMPRTPPDWSKLTLSTAFYMVDQLQAWFSNFGFSGRATPAVSLVCVVLILFGIFAGIRSGQGKGIAICLLFCLVPSLILAVLVTSNPVFQRYVLFIGPFYFLLVSNGVANMIEAARRIAAGGLLVRALRVAGVGSLAFVTMAWAFGTFNYIRPETHSILSYRPDFRGVSKYLSGAVHKGDLIVLADDPSVGINVMSYYWHGAPPALMFDARDPLLAEQRPNGDIYWVVSSLDPELIQLVGEGGRGWADVATFERAVVLHETRNAGGAPLQVMDSMSHLADIMSPALASERHVLTLRGSVYQARGDLADAADAYRNAGDFLPLADEYLRTADGYASLGQADKAWREAVIAKGMQPSDIQVHAWLANKLEAEGHMREGQAEAEIAKALRVSAGGAFDPLRASQFVSQLPQVTGGR